MVSQLRYPGTVVQEECSDCGNWNNLDNVKMDDWEHLASCNLKPKQKPAPFRVSNFNFNVPEGVHIKYICAELDYTRIESDDPIKIGPPVLIINDELKKTADVEATLFQLNRLVKFRVKDLDLKGEDVNSEDFGITIEFPENTSSNEGILNFDFIRVRIEYEPPRYILSCDETVEGYPDRYHPLRKGVGDEFKYTLYFRNLNGVNKTPQQVKVNVPEGLEVVKYYFNPGRTNDYNGEEPEDIFDMENMIWYPCIRGEGIARLRLVFKCTGEGKKIINSFNQYTETSDNFYVDVKPEGFKSKLTKYERAIERDSWIVQAEDTDEFKSLVKETVITIDDVSMEFDIPQEKIDTIKEYFIRWAKRDIKPNKHFKALQHVSCEIERGERVGIIGFNGAGKSTLLKVLAGVLKPTEGSTTIEGKVAPLLELGAGFDHNYSGRENIFLNGAILGYSKEFLESKYDEIVEFSELEDFIDIPIKNYSSGMVAKLGFAVATVVDPEILILDEILSVGDVRFQKKSGDKIRSMIKSGTTVLLVSHSTAKIKELCNRAIWLDKGKVVMDGDVDEVCEAYIEAAEEASDEELRDLEFV